MGIDIGIDIGGTFTDCFAAGANGRMWTCKTPTTHFDLSVGFMNGMRELARLSDSSLETFLSELTSIRYATTIGTNAVIERSGPKLGLIMTAGFEDTIFLGRSRSWADGVSLTEMRDMARIRKPEPLIKPDMVVGLRERIDSAGNVITPLDPDDVLEQIQTLVDRGAMGFVVSLLWSFVNPSHEQRVKEIIEQEYPEDYLGAMPVVLSSEISPKAGEYTRTMTAVVNAYIHGIMADELGKLGNELHDGGYTRPLILVHNTGGNKKASRTRAVHTHNAGPVAGMYGASLLGGASGDANIIFTDMGGTSFDIGVIANGEIKAHDFIPVIDRWRTNIPAIEVKSIGAGGGSIASVNKLIGNALEVGPASAGAMPGPACYDQGGTLPTVTDADLVLGLYDPDNYAGGDLLLDPALAREAITEHIARPLRIEAVEAAYRIRRVIDARMGQEVFNEVALKGHDPRRFVLYACGGAGAAHACHYAPYLRVAKVIVPVASSVFGALGASAMGIRQVWEKSKSFQIFQWATQSYREETAQFNAVVVELLDLATRDLRLEGYAEHQMRFTLELDLRYGSQHNLTRIEAPRLTLTGAGDFRELCELFTRRYSEIYSAEATFLQGGVNIENFLLTASVEATPFSLATADLAGPLPSPEALTGSRGVYWGPDDGFEDTPTYTLDGLLPGNRITGPALIDSRQTTFVIPHAWRFTMDRHGSGVLEQRPKHGSVAT